MFAMARSLRIGAVSKLLLCHHELEAGFAALICVSGSCSALGEAFHWSRGCAALIGGWKTASVVSAEAGAGYEVLGKGEKGRNQCEVFPQAFQHCFASHAILPSQAVHRSATTSSTPATLLV